LQYAQEHNPEIKAGVGIPEKYPYHYPMMLGHAKVRYYRLPERRPAGLQIDRKNKKSTYSLRRKCLKLWSGQQDSNLRPPAPKAGALTRLRYAPTLLKKARFFVDRT
jgi:hypothetical protein